MGSTALRPYDETVWVRPMNDFRAGTGSSLKKPAILFVSHSAGRYGAEKSLLDLVLGLDRDRYDVIILVPRKGPLTDILSAHGIRYITVFYTRWIDSRLIFAKLPIRTIITVIALIRLLLIIKSYSIRVIYTNTVVIPIGALLSRFLGIPHIWHIREFVQEDRGARFIYGTTRSMRLISQTSERVICNSKAIRSKMGQYIPAKKLAVVYNGLLGSNQTTLELSVKKVPDPQDKLVLCMAGAIAAHKGHRDAIIALSILRKRAANAHLVILGMGHWLHIRALKRLASKLGVSEQIDWLGYLQNALDVFRSSHVLLVCSRFEPFGRVAVEAMSVGTPVIGTDAGGLTEIIDHGYTGLLYPAGNHQLLADQIVRLLEESNLYESISRNAILSVHKRYTRDRYINEIELIIKDALKVQVEKVTNTSH